MSGCWAVFGGSFDPPHVSHVMVATYVLSVADVAGLVVVPAFKHPLEKRASATFSDRARMCELAFADFRRIEVSRVEEDMGGESRTLFVLEELARRSPERSWRFVMGADLIAETPRWHRFDRIAEIAPPFIVGRGGYAGGTEIPIPAVSSSDVRARIQGGGDVSELVPRAVAEHIASRGLYAAGPA